MTDLEAPDWDPDDESFIKEEWTPGVLDMLKESNEFVEFKARRKFRFVHLFSGPHDVLKSALMEEAGREGVLVTVESYDREGDGRHDLAADSPYDEILGSADSIDGYHSGFPCGSFSMVRNREGGPPPVRSRLEPYGLSTNDRKQQAEADKGTVLAVRSTIIAAEVLDCQRRKKLGEVATLENPPGSESGVDLPAWLLPEVRSFMQKYQTTSARFNTCRYQTGKTRWYKPARWEGRLQDLDSLSGRCSCPSWVVHDALLGKDRTARAAEYPIGLAQKYAKLVIKVFKQNLQLEWWRFQLHTKKAVVSKLQANWMKSREAKTPPPVQDKASIVGSKRAWAAGNLEKDSMPQGDKDSKKQRKEKENEFYLGGMRNPEMAVAKLFRVKQVGADISRAWSHFILKYPKALELAVEYGGENAEPDLEIAGEWQKHLGKILKVKEFEDIVMKEEYEFQTPLNTQMWAAWIRCSGDPERHVVDWARKGVPLGMEREIPTCGIFPEAEDEPISEESAPNLELMENTRNYSSFYDLQEEAAGEVQRLVHKGFAVVKSKKWVKERFGSGTVSRMALIQKFKDNGQVKNRIIVDMLRSGGNSRARVPERLVLPRVVDVVEGARRLWSFRKELHDQAEAEGWMPEDPGALNDWELIGADLSDAFCHYPVCSAELPNCLCPGVGEDEYIIFTALLFGFKAAPLLMARLSSLISRFVQSLMTRAEGVMQTYMDDPLILLAGPKARRDRTLSMILYSLAVMGVNLAFGKGERGLRVTWIGVVFELHLASRVIQLTVSQKMIKEVKNKLAGWNSAGMVGLRDLRALTGRLSWIAGVLPRCRWAVSIMYSVIASAEKDAKDGTEVERAAKRGRDQRPKPHLVPVKRFLLPKHWFMHLLENAQDLLLRVEPMEPEPFELCISTDASPQGVGAVLGVIDMQQNQVTPWMAFEAPVRPEDAAWLGVTYGESSSQGVLEAWTVLLAVRLWKTKLRGKPFLLKSDSTVALAMASKLSSSSPTINWVGAELALRLELLGIRQIRGHHLPGTFNKVPDWLSRPHEREPEIPPELQGIRIQAFDGVARRKSILPPPGVSPELWGQQASTVSQAFVCI